MSTSFDDHADLLYLDNMFISIGFFSSDYAFLCVEEYFHAMCVCLQAVEQNRVTLLAELDVSLVSLNLELKQ